MTATIWWCSASATASIYQPLLTKDLIDVVSRGKAKVGIFGTQYRELISRPALDRLIDRLDTWFARYEDDVLMYGRGRTNVQHLGDWLINQFPMSTPTDEGQLQIGEEIWNELPLDRTIQFIQRYKNVLSSRLHPLLCATHLGRDGGLYGAARRRRNVHHIRQVPEHADRHLWPKLSREDVLSRRSRCGHALQEAGPRQYRRPWGAA